jgi:hypothetical protein
MFDAPECLMPLGARTFLVISQKYGSGIPVYGTIWCNTLNNYKLNKRELNIKQQNRCSAYSLLMINRGLIEYETSKIIVFFLPKKYLDRIKHFFDVSYSINTRFLICKL